jgi:Protein of unknown function (DUF455)
MPPYPQGFDEAMRRCVHDLVFSETEALDVFGRYMYELGGELPWQFTFESARIAWDEARHVELLLNVLARYGGTIGAFPAKAPGYEEYVRLPTTLQKLIMVNVIAERRSLDRYANPASRSVPSAWGRAVRPAKGLRNGGRGESRAVLGSLGPLARTRDRSAL